MIEVIGGNLFQWDTGRVAQVNTDANVHEVHFTTKDMTYAYVVSTYEKDGTVYCEIPNILLQQEKSLICYEVTNTDSGEMTVAETTLALHKRNKPQDYAYTQDELKNFDRLAALIPTNLSQLTDNIGAGGAKITSVNGILPDENGNVEVQAGINSADVARIVKDEFAGGVGYTETQTYSVTWDGDTTDKVSDSTGMYYKVSDSTPDISGLQEINVVISNGNSLQGNADSIYEIPGKLWSFNFVICVLEAGITADGKNFPETGMYVVNYSGVYVSEVEYTLHNVKRISRDYIPTTPEFVVDATNLPTDNTGSREFYTALEDAYNPGHDIFLDVNGSGYSKLKLTNKNNEYFLFLEVIDINTIYAYILVVYKNDGVSLRKLSLTTTEVT